MSDTQKPASIHWLPIEVHVNIICRLDPIGVMSLSQTCSRFRHIVSPGKKELVERLLALECQEQYGGKTPILRGRDGTLEPPWPGDEWEDMRWACAGCLRLLSHLHFDNRSILRLHLRKPIPGSFAAKHVTTWQPSLRGKTWGRRHHQPRTEEERKQSHRQKVVNNPGVLPPNRVGWFTVAPLGIEDPQWTAHGLRSVGVEGLENMDEAEFRRLPRAKLLSIYDKNARDMEAERCGWKRCTRKCNECRYQARQLGRQISQRGGIPSLPIQLSRKLRFASAQDRYFPGLSAALGIELPTLPTPIGEVELRSSPVPTWGLSPEGVYDKAWNMYMVRCPGCHRWQEMRAFRLGNYPSNWVPKIGGENWDDQVLSAEYLSETCCNKCFSQKLGTHELGARLLAFLNCLIVDWGSIGQIEFQLCFGWMKLYKMVSELPREYRRPIRHMLRDTYSKALRLWKEYDAALSYSEVALLRLRHGQFLSLWTRLKTDKGQSVHELTEDFWFDTWLTSFDNIEARWLWTKRVMDEARERPDALADWALVRDDASLH